MKTKKLPDFSTMTMAEEVAFWDNAELTEYISAEDINKHSFSLREKPKKPKKPKEELVAFRLEKKDLDLLSSQANELGIGRSTLLRMVVKKFLTNPDHSLI